MPIAVQCPECDARLNAPDAAAGKTVKCPKCKAPMVIPDAESAAGDEFETVDDAPAKKPASIKKTVVKKEVDDDDDDRPKTKKRPRDDDDEDDNRPKRKGKKKKPAAAGMAPVVLIGIIAGGVLLVGGAGFAIYWFTSSTKPNQTASDSNTVPPVNPVGQVGGPVPGVAPPTGPGGTNSPTTPVKAVIPVSDSRSRAISNNNLKQVGLAFHNFDSVYGGLPAGYFDTTGQIGLSWRVAILPFIEQDSLYKEFKLNEPWNSEHNIKLLPRMPKQFAPPGGAGKEGFTYYRSFTGPTTPFPGGQKGQPGQPAKGISLSSFTDGTSNTAVVVEAGDPVEWTKPDELVYTPDGSLPRVGGIFGDGVHFTLADASTAFVRKLTPEKLKALITASGGEVVDWRD